MSTLLDSHTRALDAGHAAAAAGRWTSAAARFADARDAAPDASIESAVALTNLGHALARAGRWAEARETLRDAADAREALLAAGRVEAGVAARGWGDLAALLSAAGPEDAAHDALLRARARLGDVDDARLHAALSETAALLGGATTADDDTSADDGAMWLGDTPAFDAAEPPTYEMPTVALDVAVDTAVDVPVELPLLTFEDTVPSRSASADPLSAALDAAIASVADDAADDAADDGTHGEDAELLTPGVDPSALSERAAGVADDAGPRVAAPGRVAAIDAIVELTEAAQQPPAGGFRSLLRRLIGR